MLYIIITVVKKIVEFIKTLYVIQRIPESFYIYIHIHTQLESVNQDIVYPTNPPSNTLLSVTDLAPL